MSFLKMILIRKGLSCGSQKGMIKMNMVQCGLQFATVSVPAEVSRGEIRPTVANVVTNVGTKAKNTTTTTTKGVIGSIGVIALIVCVFMLPFGKEGRALGIIVCVIVAYLVITNVQVVWTRVTSFVR